MTLRRPPVPYNAAPILAYTNDGTGHFIESTSQVLGDVKAFNAQHYYRSRF